MLIQEVFLFFFISVFAINALLNFFMYLMHLRSFKKDPPRPIMFPTCVPDLCLQHLFLPLSVSLSACLCSFSQTRAMADRDLAQQFEDQVQDVLSRLQSKELFRSDWDIASFAMFFIFIGEWTRWIGFPGPFKEVAEPPCSSKRTLEDGWMRFDSRILSPTCPWRRAPPAEWNTQRSRLGIESNCNTSSCDILISDTDWQRQSLIYECGHWRKRFSDLEMPPRYWRS